MKNDILLKYRNLASKYTMNDMSNLYLISIGVYIFFGVIQDTTFNIPLPSRVPNRIEQLCLIVIGYKIFFYDAIKYNDICKYLAGFFIILLIKFNSGYYSMFDFYAIILGARGVSFRSIVKVYAYITGGVLIIAFISSILGIIPDTLTYGNNGIVRHGFGIGYTTSFAAHIFFLMVAVLMITYPRKVMYLLLIMAGITFLIYEYCHTRVDVACMGLLLLGYIIFGNHDIKKNKYVVLLIANSSKYIMFTLSMICLYFAWIYDPNVKWLQDIDVLLSGRLHLSHTGLVDYSLTLFGQQIQFVSPSVAIETGKDYFFIDSVFQNTLMKYGVISLIILNLLYYYICKRIINFKNGVFLCYIVVLFAINGAIAPHIMEMWYCPFGVMLCADMEK